MIRYKDGAETVRHAADVISACGPRPDLVLKLRQLAIVLEAAAPVPVPPRAPLRAPTTDYEAAHCLSAADALDRNEHATAIAHIVEAAAHRVMSQVIGAIDKVNAARPTPTDAASARQGGDRRRGWLGAGVRRPKARKGARKAARR
jgi:hypothetical protein